MPVIPQRSCLSEHHCGHFKYKGVLVVSYPPGKLEKLKRIKEYNMQPNSSKFENIYKWCSSTWEKEIVQN